MTPMFAGGATTLLLVLFGLLVFTFLAQRPLKKQMEAQNQLRASLAEGQRVLLTSQIFGTLTHVGDEQVIVEIAPGMEVTATKQAVVRVVAPDEEEFEFADPDDVEQDTLDAAQPGGEPAPQALDVPPSAEPRTN